MLIVTALSVKIRHIEDYFNENIAVEDIRKNIEKADTRAKYLYVVLTLIYVITAVSLVVLSFPILKIIK